MTPPPSEALLRLSHALLTSPAMDDPVSVRAAALLGRQAVEQAVVHRLAYLAPGSENVASNRAKLLCLQAADRQAGVEASQLWSALTRACHHHPYELNPTTAEVLELIEHAARVCRTLVASPLPLSGAPQTVEGGVSPA